MTRPQPNRTKALTVEEWAAGRYFLRNQNPMHTLDLLAHDSVHGSTETADAATVWRDQKAHVSKAKTAPKQLMGQKYKAPDGADPASPELQYHAFTGRKYADPAIQWVRNNMSPAAVQYLGKVLHDNRHMMSLAASRFTKKDDVATQLESKSPEERAAREAAARKDRLKVAREDLAKETARYEFDTITNKPKVTLGDGFGRMLAEITASDPSAAISQPVHPAVRAALREGDLGRALYALAITTNNRRVAQLATVLSEFAGDTRVNLERPVDMYPEISKPLDVGMYVLYSEADYAASKEAGDWRVDAFHNSILLDPDNLTVHLLLHEAAHMATARVLDNRAHPTTRRIMQLFKEMEPIIKDMYGGENIYEFSSEALSNSQFRSILHGYRPAGQTRTGWQRFSGFLKDLWRGFMGLPPRADPDSVLTEVDRLLNAILDKAPEFSTDPDRANMHALTRRGSEEILQSAVRKVSKFDANAARRVGAMLLNDGIPSGVKSGFLGLVPLHNLADMAKGIFGTELMTRLRDISNELSGTLQVMHKRINDSLKPGVAWMRANQELIPEYNWLTFKATRAQVNPAKPRSTYKKDPEKLKTWDELQPVWRKLQRAGGDKVYHDLRNIYEYMRHEAAAALRTRIQAYTKDKKQTDAIYQHLYDKVFAENLIDPYAPLTRSGKYWLEYSATNPDTKLPDYFKESFDSLSKRNEKLAELKEAVASFGGELGDVKPYTNIRPTFDRSAPSGPFVRDLMDKLKTSNVDGTVQTEILEMVLELVPERSFLNSFRGRKEGGVSGHDGDITPTNFRDTKTFDPIHAAHQRALNMARQISRMKANAEAQTFRADLDKQFQKWEETNVPQTDAAYQLYKELVRRADLITGGERSRWSREVTGGLFFMTMGFNASSVIVNMFALPTIIAGYLGGKYGLIKTAKAMGEATRLIASSGRERDVERIGPNGEIITERGKAGFLEYGLDQYDLSDPRNAKIAFLKPLIDRMRATGHLNRSLMFEMANLDEQSAMDSPTSWAGQQWELARAASGWPFHISELHTRQTTAVSAYLLGLRQKFGDRDLNNVPAAALEAAAVEAIQDLELTNSTVAATAAPRWAMNNVGAIFLLFKKYMFSMIGLQVTLVSRAIRNAEPGARRMALTQLAQINGLLALFSGLAGVPLYGMIADLWNLAFTDDDDEDFETMTRIGLGELGYKGLLNYVTGREVSSRIGLNDMLFRESLQDLPLWADIISGFSGPSIGLLGNMERGWGKMANGEIQRGFEDISPAFARSLIRAGRYGIEGEATTLRDDAIISDLGIADVIGQALGFAPAEYVYQLDMNAQYKDIDRAIGEQRQKLTKKLYLALRQRDYAEARAIRADIAEFNRKNPQWPIMPENIKDSLKQHEETTSTMSGGVQYSPRNRPMLDRMRKEWDSPTLW